MATQTPPDTLPPPVKPPGFKQVTVVGGAGFLGRYIVRALAQRGWRIVVASRDPERALYLKTSGAVGQIVPVLANVRDDASITAAVAGSDVVINLVGLLYESGKNSFAATHADGAARVARLAKAAGAESFVQVSAIGASPRSPSKYARTKAAGERAVLDAFPEATILRPSIVFGPEDGFFNLFADLARFSPVLPLVGGGKTRFQPVYVADVARAVEQAIDRPDARGKTYELGGPEVVTFRECLERMRAVTRQKVALMPLPWPIAALQARVMGLLPKPLLTTDQLAQLRIDNVVAEGASTLADLGVEATALDAILPSYLDRYRPGGAFGQWRERGA